MAPGSVDIVLMDVQMPVLDGHDATQRIRLELQLGELPIIALTAGALSSERQRAAAAGMDDYIVKPFDAHGLISCIVRHTQALRSAAVPRGGELPLPHASSSAPAERAWPEIDGIDTHDVRERLSGDVELFRSMLRRLLDEFAEVAMPDADFGGTAAMRSTPGARTSCAASPACSARAKSSKSPAKSKPPAPPGGRALSSRSTAGWRTGCRCCGSVPQSRSPCRQRRATSTTRRRPCRLRHKHSPSWCACCASRACRRSITSARSRRSCGRQLGAVPFERVREQIDNLQFSDAAQTLETCSG